MTSRPLTDDEILLISQNLKLQRDKCLFILGVKTGFRISELLSLTISDVQGDRITVKRSCMKGKQKSRTVPLHPLAKTAILDYLNVRLDKIEPKLFDIGRRQAWNIVKTAARQAGLTGTISTHSMRKTLGMGVYKRSGNNVVAAMRALGHKSLSSTTHYLSIGQDEVDQLILSD